MKTLNFSLLVLTLIGLCQVVSLAQTPAISNPGNSVRTGFNGNVGYEFTLSSSEILDSLGALDLGLTATPEVGIYTTSGTLLASATVTSPGTALDDGLFDYSSVITKANGFNGTLSAGTYVIGEYVDGDGFEDDNGHVVLTAGGVTLDDSEYSSTGAFAFPDTADHTPGGTVGTSSSSVQLAYVGPNFEFSTPIAGSVPEPSTYALLGIGILALAFACRRYRGRSRSA